MSDTQIRVHLAAVQKALKVHGGALTFGIFGVELSIPGQNICGIDKIADKLNEALEQSDGAERLI